VLDDLFRPASPVRDAAFRRAYIAAGVYALFVLARLLAWSHVGLALQWLMVIVGAALTIWQWRAYLAANRVDPTFAARNTISSVLNIPLLLGTVMSVGDAYAVVKQTL
jgi:hypothetical protein